MKIKNSCDELPGVIEWRVIVLSGSLDQGGDGYPDGSYGFTENLAAVGPTSVQVGEKDPGGG